MRNDFTQEDLALEAALLDAHRENILRAEQTNALADVAAAVCTSKCLHELYRLTLGEREGDTK